jgi:SAM-dependent methyltransferase
VLHHLDLPRAYAELARVLKPDGVVVATEALKHNLVIQAYRKFTPHLRTEWEVDHILGRQEIGMARKYFGDVRVRRFFHLTTLAAMPLTGTKFLEPMRRMLYACDSVLLRLPGLRWQAWMAVFTLSAPRDVP